MVVKINANEIYKITQSCSCNEMEEIFGVLPQELQVFAKYKVGAGFYQWTLPGEGWIRLSDTDELDAIDVRNCLREKKESVRSILSSTSKINVDNIFTTPGDDYVFFKTDGSELNVVLAAWDYKFPVKPQAGGVVLGGPKLAAKQKVVLSFTETGGAASNYRFGYKTYTGRTKMAITDENGKFELGELLVGKSYSILPGNSTAPVVIVPEKGKQEYTIDITRAYTVNVSITKDGMLMDNCPVVLNYAGAIYNCNTSGGKASVELPYSAGAACLISVEGEQRSVSLQYPETDVSFEFETQYFPVKVYLYKNGMPYSGVFVSLSYDGQNGVVMSNQNGEVTYKFPYEPGKVVSVNVEGQIQSQQADLQSNTFRFDFYEDIMVNPHILVLNEHGSFVPLYELFVRIEGVETKVATNSEGKYNLPILKVGQVIQVLDCNNLNNSAEYTISEHSDEYIFTVKAPVVRKLEFTVQDDKAMPYSNHVLTLNQNGKDAVLYLDLDGKAVLDRSIFAFGENVQAILNVNGANKTSFNLVLDEDEDEYLLIFSTKEKTAWWRTFLAVLLIILIMILVFFFWYLITNILF